LIDQMLLDWSLFTTATGWERAERNEGDVSSSAVHQQWIHWCVRRWNVWHDLSLQRGGLYVHL